MSKPNIEEATNAYLETIVEDYCRDNDLVDKLDLHKDMINDPEIRKANHKYWIDFVTAAIDSM